MVRWTAHQAGHNHILEPQQGRGTTLKSRTIDFCDLVRLRRGGSKVESFVLKAAFRPESSGGALYWATVSASSKSREAAIAAEVTSKKTDQRYAQDVYRNEGSRSDNRTGNQGKARPTKLEVRSPMGEQIFPGASPDWKYLPGLEIDLQGCLEPG